MHIHCQKTSGGSLFLARTFSTLIALLPVLSFSASAQNAAYPVQPIRLLVGFPAGGAGDGLARILGEHLAGNMGQPVVVDNRVGAGGKIAAELLSQAAPNGYTLMLTSAAPIIVAPALGQKLNFSPSTLSPVAKLTDSMVVLLVNPSLKIDSVRDLIAMAKAKPGSLSYASPGIGTVPHLSGELMQSMAQIKMVHVPYKGTSAIMPAQISGEIMLSLVPLGAAMTQIRAKRLKPIGVTGQSRSVTLPEVATFSESGLNGFDVNMWYGMFAPGKTPTAIIEKLNLQILKTLQIPSVRERLLNMALEPSGSAPEQLGALVLAEEKLWAKVVKDAKLKID